MNIGCHLLIEEENLLSCKIALPIGLQWPMDKVKASLIKSLSVNYIMICTWIKYKTQKSKRKLLLNLNSYIHIPLAFWLNHTFLYCSMLFLIYSLVKSHQNVIIFFSTCFCSPLVSMVFFTRLISFLLSVLLLMFFSLHTNV